MSEGNGNGVDPKIKAATRDVAKYQQPLAQLDERIAQQRRKVNAAAAALATAEAAYTNASSAFADEVTDKNRERLKDTNEDIDVQKANLKEHTQRLSRLEAERPALDDKYQRASSILSQVSVAVRQEALEKEMDTANYKIAEHNQAAFEWTRRLNTMKKEYNETRLRVQDAEDRANRARMQQDARARNPYGPGGSMDRGERVRY
jgi:chromosome segregation ATPase